MSERPPRASRRVRSPHGPDRHGPKRRARAESTAVAPPQRLGREVPFLVAVRAVLMTELRGLARDRRAVMLSLLLPVALYPLVFFFNSWLERLSRETLAAREVHVALELSIAPSELAERLRTRLAQEIPIQVQEIDPGDTERLAAALERGTDDAREVEREELGRLAGPDGHLFLQAAHSPAAPGRVLFRAHYDGASELSNEALDRVRRALEDVRGERRTEILSELFGGDPAAGLELELVDVASEEDKSGAAIGRLLPLIAVLVLLSGGSYAALSAFAGEREGGTLETLLVQPVDPNALVWGKFGAVFGVGILTLALNATSVLACLALGIGALPGTSGPDGEVVSLAVGLPRILTGAVVFLPACVLVCALLSLVCGRARSFREGQNYLLPLVLVAMVPCVLATRPEVELDWLLACVPLAGPALAFRDSLTGNLTLLPAALVVLSSVLWSWFALARLAPLLDAERVLASPDTEREAGLRHLQSRRALALGLAGVIAVYVIGGLLQSAHALWGLMLTLWVLLPALAWIGVRKTARRAGETPGRALWLRLPAPWHALGAILIAPGLAQLMQRLFAWQQEVLPLPSSLTSESAVPPELAQLGPLAAFLALALSPGITEELFFRGAVLSGLRRDLSWRKVIVWQALLFGAVHASIHRFVPTALMGGLLAAIVLRARSLWPAVIAHVAYNGLLVSQDLPAVQRLFAGREGWIIPITAVGAALLALPGRSGADGQAGRDR